MSRLYLHPLPLRLWHWLTAAIVVSLLGTGWHLRFHGIAALSPHDPVLIWHKGIGLAMVAVTVFWLVYAMANESRRRHYLIRGRDLRGMVTQARFYLFTMFTGGENPFRPSAAAKYNPLQKLAYGGVMFILLPFQGLTGLLFMDIPPLRDQLLSANLIGFLDAGHVLCSYLLALYLIVHLYMATLGRTWFSHIRAMITGYEEEGVGGQDEVGR